MLQPATSDLPIASCIGCTLLMRTELVSALPCCTSAQCAAASFYPNLVETECSSKPCRMHVERTTFIDFIDFIDDNVSPILRNFIVRTHQCPALPHRPVARRMSRFS